jgi:hypothetical protein
MIENSILVHINSLFDFVLAGMLHSARMTFEQKDVIGIGVAETDLGHTTTNIALVMKGVGDEFDFHFDFLLKGLFGSDEINITSLEQNDRLKFNFLKETCSH